MTSNNIRILIYNSKLPNNNFHLARCLKRAFDQIEGVESAIAHPHTLGLLSRTFDPAAVVAFGGEEITSETISVLGDIKRSQTIPWILWTTEDPFELEVTQTIAPFFDMVLTSDKGSLYAYADHPSSHYVPLAADRQLHYRPVRSEPERILYDLVFVGTAWPNRISFLSELHERMTEASLRPRFLVPTNPSLPKNSLDKIGEPFEREVRVAPKDLGMLQNQSRFALTVLREFSRHSKTARPQTSPTNRFFETALAGTGQIFVSEAFDIASFYEEIGPHVLQPESISQIIEALKAAKQDPLSRNAAAAALQEFVISNHLSYHRALQILSLLGLRV